MAHAACLKPTHGSKPKHAPSSRQRQLGPALSWRRRHPQPAQARYTGLAARRDIAPQPPTTHLSGCSSFILCFLGGGGGSSSSTLAFCLCLNDPVLLQLGHASTRHHVTCLCLRHLAEVFDGHHALFAELHGERDARFLQANFERHKGISKRLQFRRNRWR